MFFAALFLAACSSDDNGIDDNVGGDDPQTEIDDYAGTYTGHIGYQVKADHTETQQGTVKVTKMAPYSILNFQMAFPR